MINKYCKETSNCFGEKVHILYFKPFDDEEELIKFSKDKDGDYICK